MAVLSLSLVGGCKEKEVRELGAKLATSGQTVADAAIKTYNDLDDQTDVESELENYLRIIDKPPAVAATFPQPQIQLSSFQKQIAERQAAYKSFHDMYAALFKLSDTAFGDQSAKAATALQTSYDSLKNLPDLPASVSAQLPGIASLLTDLITAKNIKKANLAIYQICLAYEALWNSEKVIFTDSLDEEYNSYANSLWAIPADRFDAEKLKEVVKEPLTAPYRVSLYKRSVLKEYRGQQLEVKKEMNSVSVAFGLLKTAHEQLAAQKTTPTLDDFSALLDRIEPVLKDVLK